MNRSFESDPTSEMMRDYYAMNESLSTIDVESSVPMLRGDGRDHAIGLMIAWSSHEPTRVGEIALVPMEGATAILGRGGSQRHAGRLSFVRQRPGENIPTGPLASPAISREQLRITRDRGGLLLERVGRCPLLVRGAPVDGCFLVPGETVQLRGQLVLLCVSRPAMLPPLRDFPVAACGAFGEPDTLALLGESEVLWRLREALSFQARAGAHALVLGPSGAGKELAARALHALSRRAAGPFVSRSAATIPAGLVDAELFGNARNYPNPGTSERPGLIGAAHNGTLFLDEIGEMPQTLHANLLRVLDSNGEYHRLGEADVRRADLRFVAATNRPPETLKHDLLARLSLRVVVPGLDARREDIPLLVRHLLRRALTRSPEVVARFCDERGEVRTSADMVERLVHRPYATHVRELDGLLWRAMTESTGTSLDLRDGSADVTQRVPMVEAPRVEPLTGPGLLAAIADHGGNLALTARALGLPSRYALYRLLRRHGVALDEARRGE